MNQKIPSGFDLGVDEDVIWSGRRSWKSVIFTVIGLFFLLILFVILGTVDFFFVFLGDHDLLLRDHRCRDKSDRYGICDH